jgi:integrase
MAHYEKRGKTWRCRYLKPDGTYGSESGFRTKAAAKRFAEDQESQIHAKTWVDPESGKITLDKYWSEWAAAQKLSESTRDRYTSYFDNHLSPWKGGTPIREITGLQTDAFKKDLREEKGLAVSTVTAVVGLLGRMMADAVFYRLIVSSPVRPSSRRGEKEPDEARKGQSVELEAVQAIRTRLPAPEALLALVCVFTGMRWGEVAGMRRKFLYLMPGDGEGPASGWYEVDQKVGALKERNGTLTFGPPKDREARLIELPGFLVELLLAHLEALPARQRLLFTTGVDEPWRRSNFNRRRWRPACDGWEARAASTGHPARAAAPPVVEGLRFHDLRHTQETWLTEDHIPKIARDARLGHVTPGMEGTYNHVTPKMRAEILAVLTRRWECEKSRTSI